ncbi:LPD7 domain-containing protein [Paraburkholderia lycopersici]|uniref:Large polyvalent protein-associated domain-containing protein n=1 Tax=Paraburkholderia lycopersici TaxID=416944 RepID=A0A1G7A359_9BURK|nr:LPD7 domain-containing protein [Paraburkholderia lycopersici]SDE09232.1 hypothetical protein SAMN05421548_13268 [Paraburkholderia lycopersici]
MDEHEQTRGHGVTDTAAPIGEATAPVNSIEREWSHEHAALDVPPTANQDHQNTVRSDWVDPAALDALKRRRQRDLAAAREGMQVPSWAPPGLPSAETANGETPTDRVGEQTAVRGVARQMQPGQTGKPPSGETKPAAASSVAAPLATPPDSVSKRFLQVGPRYFLRDGSREMAFEDRGVRMVTAHNRPDIAESMAEMALAKGWTHIRVKGHEDFRRAAWMEAAVRGIGVTGYVPNERDRASLAELMQARMTNRVEQMGSAGTPVSEKLASKEAAPATGWTGQLIQHGAAPYQHEADGTRSYFVTLRDSAGTDKTVWGVDLERAMQASGAQSGQMITLSNLGRQPVTVNEPVRDVAGQVIGEQPKAVERNVWRVELVGTERVPHDMPSSSRSGTKTTGSPAVDQQGPTVQPMIAPTTVDMTGWSHESEFRGELVAHGRAPYQNRVGAQPTYFATLREPDGRQLTVWGADLERAIAAEGGQPGDRVRLANYGRRRVDADVVAVNGEGTVTGAERRTIERYVWTATAEPRTPTPDESTERSDPQRALHMSVIAEAMRAQGFSDRSVAKVQAKADLVLNRLNEQGVPVPVPRVFDPTGRTQQPRSRDTPAAPAVAPEVERVLHPATPAVPSR